VVAEDAEMVTVQAGRLTVRVLRSELEAVPVAPTGRRPATRAATVSIRVREGASRELNLLGRTTDEARPAVEKFLDAPSLRATTRSASSTARGPGRFAGPSRSCSAATRSWRASVPAAREKAARGRPSSTWPRTGSPRP